MSLTRRFVNFMLSASSFAIPCSFADRALAEPGDLYQQHNNEQAFVQIYRRSFKRGGCPRLETD